MKNNHTLCPHIFMIIAHNFTIYMKLGTHLGTRRTIYTIQTLRILSPNNYKTNFYFWLLHQI